LPIDWGQKKSLWRVKKKGSRTRSGCKEVSRSKKIPSETGIKIIAGGERKIDKKWSSGNVL